MPLMFSCVECGVAIILVTPISSQNDACFFRGLFDFSGVDIDFRFQVLTSPIRSSRGKVPLIVSFAVL